MSSIEKVKKHLSQWGLAHKVQEFSVSSATVELAAQALNVIPARIAKSLTFADQDNCLMVVAAGDARINSSKYKQAFGKKPNMLSADRVLDFTGHGVGGVCPFALSPRTRVYLDVSLKRFQTVYPACGSNNSAIELDLDQLWQAAGALDWVDVCNDWEAPAQAPAQDM